MMRAENRILVVDDSEVMRKVILSGISDLGMEVVEAGDGATALLMFEPHAYTAVLMDWNIPVLDGVEVIRHMRNYDADVPIIMITAEASKDSMKLALEAGATDYLTKPFDENALKWKLQLVQRRDTGREKLPGRPASTG